MSRKSKAEYIGEKRRAYACASAARGTPLVPCHADELALCRISHSPKQICCGLNLGHRGLYVVFHA